VTLWPADAGVVPIFCPACLRWSSDEPSEADDPRPSCASCGSSAPERFVTLLLGVAVRHAAARTGQIAAIGARPPLAAAVRQLDADAVLVPPGRIGVAMHDTGSAATVGAGTTSLVVCVDALRSRPDPHRLLGQVGRILSPDGTGIVAFPAGSGSSGDAKRSEPPESSFADAGLQWRRVVAPHVLPMRMVELTALERGEPVWFVRRATSSPLPTTAEVAAGAEAEWFAAVARSGRLSEVEMRRLREAVDRSERARHDLENRLPVRLTVAALSLARSVGGGAIQTTDAVPSVDGVVSKTAPDPVVPTDPHVSDVSLRPEQPPTEVAGPQVPVGAAEAAPSVTPTADSLLRLRPGAPSPVVRLLLHEFDGERVFAGVRTALLAGAALARRLDRPLSIVLLTEPRDRSSIGALIDRLRHETRDDNLVDGVRVTCVERDPAARVHHDDIWMATYWTTAVAAGRARRAGILEARRIIYLVQDFEPGFFGWSDDSAIAATTYHEGFHLVVNSRPLARYLHDQTGVLVPPDQVFAPAVDTAALERAATSWRPDPDGHLRVLFYGRPSHPRNLFRIGLEALRLWLGQLRDGERLALRTAGADHPRYLLGDGRVIEPLGKLSMEHYLELLSRTDLTLALMFSPHPSHLSLEPPIAGIPTVTNRFGSYREPWVDGLHVAEAEPAALAGALDQAAHEARGLRMHRTQPLPASLGGTLHDAIRAVSARL
jgi:hypothetical protein